MFSYQKRQANCNCFSTSCFFFLFFLKWPNKILLTYFKKYTSHLRRECETLSPMGDLFFFKCRGIKAYCTALIKNTPTQRDCQLPLYFQRAQSSVLKAALFERQILGRKSIGKVSSGGKPCSLGQQHYTSSQKCLGFCLSPNSS